MSTIGDTAWLFTGGTSGAILWCAAGLLLCVTVAGIPSGVQCFKIALLQLAALSSAPFGTRVV
jgi:uncharacterized membrane protein YccF (DUF307 family)